MALKFIAEGFEADADELLKEFVGKESSEFQDFATVWRKRNFSFIYMGRETARDLAEFTQEIFSISLDFLVSESFWREIGSVFLLYALYRNQILNPPLLIRVELAKIEIMKRLLDKALADKLYSLHYVLDFLFKNAFEMVASRILFGPTIRIFDKTKIEFEKKLKKLDFECNLKELMENKVLEDLSESFLKYEKAKKIPRSFDAKTRCNKLINIMHKLALEKVSIDNNDLLTPSADLSSLMRSMRTPNKIRCEYPFIGPDLKKTSDADEIEENIYEDEYNFDEIELLSALMRSDQQAHRNIKRKPKKRSKSRNIRQYYEESPTKIIYKNAIQVPNMDSEDELLID